MSMMRINLIPGPRRHAATARKRIRQWSWGVVAYSMVLLAAYAACAAALTVDGDDHAAMLEKTNRQIEDMTNTNASLKPQVDEAHTKLSVARMVGDQPDWSLLLAIISSTVDDEIVLTSTKLEPPSAADVQPATRPASNDKNSGMPAQQSKMSFSLRGMARSQAAVMQFVLRLERLGLFERVDLAQSARQTVGATDANIFRIDCLLQRAGKSPTPAGGRQK